MVVLCHCWGVHVPDGKVAGGFLSPTWCRFLPHGEVALHWMSLPGRGQSSIPYPYPLLSRSIYNGTVYMFNMNMIWVLNNYILFYFNQVTTDQCKAILVQSYSKCENINTVFDLYSKHASKWNMEQQQPISPTMSTKHKQPSSASPPQLTNNTQYSRTSALSKTLKSGLPSRIASSFPLSHTTAEYISAHQAPKLRESKSSMQNQIIKTLSTNKQNPKPYHTSQLRTQNPQSNGKPGKSIKQ